MLFALPWPYTPGKCPLDTSRFPARGNLCSHLDASASQRCSAHPGTQPLANPIPLCLRDAKSLLVGTVPGGPRAPCPTHPPHSCALWGSRAPKSLSGALQRLSNGSVHPDDEAGRVVELQELLEKQNFEVVQAKERISALAASVAELEEDLGTARKDLIKSEEMSSKYQRDLREVRRCPLALRHPLQRCSLLLPRALCWERVCNPFCMHGKGGRRAVCPPQNPAFGGCPHIRQQDYPEVIMPVL